MRLLACYVAVLVCYSSVEVVISADGGDGSSEPEPCDGTVDLKFFSSASCGPGCVEGRLLVCDTGEWKNLCDSDWTEADAKVACKSLGNSPNGKKCYFLHGLYLIVVAV